MANNSEVISEVNDLILAEKAEEADRFLERAISENHHPQLLRLRKRTLLLLGDETGARQHMKSAMRLIMDPTNNEIELSGAAKARMISLSQYKILYLQVPKCGSTTVKDMLYYILNGRLEDGHVHRKIEEELVPKILKRPNLQKNFSEWLKLLVVRDPIEKIRSYHRFNIMTAVDLVKEHPGKDTFYRLSLRPSYEEFLQNFERYRQVFPSVRGHTNSLVSLAGRNPVFYDWIGNTSQIEELRQLLCDRSGLNIPAVHNFKSSAGISQESYDHSLEEGLRSFYRQDYKVFGDYF